MPNEIRVKPAARSAASDSAVTESGFASVVTSASGASPNSSSIPASTAPSCPGGSSVGVPPPTNTLATGTSASPSTRRASRSSSSTLAA